MSSSTLRRYRAERLLRRDFAGLRAQVLAAVRSRLRARGVTLDGAELEACYAEAWQGLYATVLDGELVENPSAWLVLVTFRRAIDESRAARSRRLAADALRVGVMDPDLEGTLDDRAKLQHVLEGLRSRLSARECEAASLCYLQGLTRAEAAARMGISEARMRKLMDGSGSRGQGLAGKVGALLETIGAGAWCEQQSSLMRAYAFGLLDPDGPRHALAVIHCRECPACRAHVATLRGLAAVLPPLPLRLALTGGVGGAGPGAGSSTGAGSGAGAGSGTATAGTATGSAGTVATAAGTSTGVSVAGAVVPLAAKLAVVGAIALGVGGYVAFAGATHHLREGGATSTSRNRGASPASALPRLYDARLHEARFVGAPRHVPERSVSKSALSGSVASARMRRSAQRISSPAQRAGATSEFGPERVAPAPARPLAPVTARGRDTGGVSGEFGFE